MESKPVLNRQLDFVWVIGYERPFINGDPFEFYWAKSFGDLRIPYVTETFIELSQAVSVWKIRFERTPESLSQLDATGYPTDLVLHLFDTMEQEYLGQMYDETSSAYAYSQWKYNRRCRESQRVDAVR